ncbi:unnamed protein product, partial [Cladocopium goreaui]
APRPTQKPRGRLKCRRPTQPVGGRHRAPRPTQAPPSDTAPRRPRAPRPTQAPPSDTAPRRPTQNPSAADTVLGAGRPGTWRRPTRHLAPADTALGAGRQAHPAAADAPTPPADSPRPTQTLSGLMPYSKQARNHNYFFLV